MAFDDNDIILNALITAGVQIKDEDAAELRRKLADIGDALGNSGLDSLKTISAELVRMRAGLEGDFNRLNDAAKRGLTADGMNKAETAALTAAFNRAKTYQDQLKGLVGELNKLGKMPLGGTYGNDGPNKPAITTPLFNELSALNAQFTRLAATMSAVSPLVDKVSIERKANKAREAKELQQSRQREANELRRQASERDRELREQATPVSKRAFYRGAKDNFQLTGKDDATEARKFGQAELARTRTLRELAIQDFGKDDPRTLKASKVADSVSRVMGALDERLADLKVSEPKDKKEEKVNERVRKLESDLQTSRQIRNRQQRTGRDALLSAGGLEGDVAGFKKADAAAKALKFLNGELTDSKSYLKALNAEFGESDPRVQRVAASVQRTAGYINDLTNRTEELRKAESESAKARRDIEAEAYAANRKFDANKLKEQQKVETLGQTKATLAVDRESRKETQRAGREALDAVGGLDGDVTKIKDFTAAQNAAKFLSAELKDVKAERSALTKAFKDGSPEENAATARIAHLSKQYGDLQAHISALAQAKVANNNAETQAKRIADLQAKRATSRRSDTESYRLLDLGKTDPAQLANLKEVGSAIKAGNADLRHMQAMQKALADSTGRTTTQYDELTVAIAKAADAQDALFRRRDQLERDRAALAPTPVERSRIYKEGKSAYSKNVLRPGGLESLEGSDRANARSYANEKLKEARRSFDALQRSGSASTAEMDKATNAVLSYEAALRRMNTSTAASTTQMGYLSNVFKMFLKYAIVYQGLYQVAAAFGAIGRSVVDLQAEMLEIQAVTGSSVGEMQTLGSAVTAVATNSKFALLDLTKAAKTLAQAGIPVAELNSALQSTANFAAATGTNLETAADLISTTRSVFKELNDDVIANQLAKAINVSKLTGEDLKTILSLGAQTARDFGLTSEQFLGAVATLRNAGLKASTTATGLRQSMLELFAPNDALTKALQSRYRAMGEDMGAEFVRSRFQAFAKGRAPLVAALSELKRLGFSNEGQGELARAFDVRSQNAIKAMIDNLEQLSTNEAKITFGRAAAEGARTVVDGLGASFTRLYSTISSFTYDNSSGLTGFLTSVIQKLDESIQKQGKLNNLRDATAGLSSEEKEKSAFNPDAPEAGFSKIRRLATSAASATGEFIADEYRMILPSFFPERKPKDVEDAETRALGSSRAVLVNQQRADQFGLAADALDVEAVRQGKGSTGSLAEALNNTNRELKDLTHSLEATFGADKDPKEVQALVKDYTNLSPTQREVRMTKLQADFPDTLGKMDPQQADQAMTQLQQMADRVNGSFIGFVEGFRDKLVKAKEVTDKLGSEPATNTADVEAVLYQQVLEQNSTFLKVISGQSSDLMQAQMEAMVKGSQTLSDSLRKEGPFEKLTAQYAEDVINKITKLSLTSTRAKSQGEIDLAVGALLSQFKGLDQATLAHLSMIQGLIAKASSNSNGALSGMLKDVADKIGTGVGVRLTKEQEAANKRVSTANEEIKPGIQTGDFATFMKMQPLETFGSADVRKAMADPNAIDWKAEFAGNTELAKNITKYYEDYRDNFKVTLDIDRKLTKEANERLGMEEKANNAAQRFQEAKQSKKFGAQQGALGEMTSAQLALARKELDDAKAEKSNLSKTDMSKNTQIIQRIVRAQQEVSRIQQNQAKESSRISRDKSKFDLESRKTTATLNRNEALGILKNADGNTPQRAIDEATAKYDASVEELRKIVDEQLTLDGDQNDQTKKQLQAEKQKLVMFNDSAEALALAYRKEATIRDALNEQLALALSSGNRVTDARYNQLGLEPGSRVERTRFYGRQAGLLTSQIANATAGNALDADQFQKNQTLINNGQGTDEIAIEQRKITDQMRSRRRDVDAWTAELGEIELRAMHATSTIGDAMREAFDIDMIRVGLEQAESGIESLSLKIHESLISGIEGVGDAFADSLLEGKDFFGELDKLFLDTGKAILRDVIKTYTTETIKGVLGGMTPKGKAEEGALPNAAGGGILGLVKSGYNWLTGAKEPTAPVPGAGAVGVGSVAAASTGANIFGLGASVINGSPQGAANALGGGCCCGMPGLGGLGDKEGGGIGGLAGSLLGGEGAPKPEGVLADVAAEEGKGFFDTLGTGFSGLLDGLKGGFGGLLSGLGTILGGGSGGGGALGLFAAMFKNGGMIKAATGGIITGPGTGTSDSIPGFIRSKTGKLKPLLTSNGESILNAKATSFLGADGVHALNSGQYVAADTSGMNKDINRMMTQAKPAGGTSGGAGGSNIIKESRSTSVSVSPAQMRMKLGDWLEQHILDERAKR